jgi:PAS domain-containing protein
MSPLDAVRVAAAERLVTSGTGSRGVQHLTELAARLLGAPGAGVSVVGAVQTVTGVTGWGGGSVGTELPLAESLGVRVVTDRRPLVVEDTRADGRLAGSPSVAGGEIGSYLGVPLVDGSTGLAVGVLAVFGPGPRRWTDADVALLSELADPVATELELSAVVSEFEAGKVRWGLAIEAAGIGSFDWDVAGDELTWDDRMVELFGYDRGELTRTVDDFTRRVHPDDVARVTDELREAVDTCGAFESEYRVVLPAGVTRWVQGRGRALGDDRGTAVRFLGAAYDTTEQRHGDARVARVLETMSAAFYSLDREWRFSYVNAEAERLLGRSREELLAGLIWDLFPGAVGSIFEAEYRGAVALRRGAGLRGLLPAAAGRVVRAARLAGPRRSVGLLPGDHRAAGGRGARPPHRGAALAHRRGDRSVLHQPGRGAADPAGAGGAGARRGAGPG